MDAPAGQCRAAMYGGFPRRVVAPKGRSSGLRVGTGDAELLHAMAQRRRLDAQTYRGAALALDDPVRFAQRVQNVDSLYAIEIAGFGLLFLVRAGPLIPAWRGPRQVDRQSHGLGIDSQHRRRR